MSDSSQPHGHIQHARLFCPLSLGVCSDSCPLSRWCYLTILSSTTPSPPAFNSLPASRSFPASLLFASGDQNIRASASVIPVHILGWFPLILTGLLSLQSKGLSRVFSSTTIQKHQFFSAQPSLWSNSYIHTCLLERHSFDYTDFLSAKWYLCFWICSACHNFPSKEQASFNFMVAVTVCSYFGAQENKICYCFHFSPYYLPWSDGIRCQDLSFLTVELQQGCDPWRELKSQVPINKQVGQPRAQECHL